uniref:Uncharacterized protein n=1 Tax=Anguilla anguilla TaxID=7936 RepID=A0A0E9VBW6_ANGAN
MLARKVTCNDLGTFWQHRLGIQLVYFA